MQWLLWISLAWGAVSEAEWQELAGQTVRLESTNGKQLEGKIVSLRDETVRIERTRDGLLVEVRKDEVSSALNLSAPTPDPSPAQQPTDTTEPVTEPMTEPMTEPVTEPVTEPEPAQATPEEAPPGDPSGTHTQPMPPPAVDPAAKAAPLAPQTPKVNAEMLYQDGYTAGQLQAATERTGGPLLISACLVGGATVAGCISPVPVLGCLLGGAMIAGPPAYYGLAWPLLEEPKLVAVPSDDPPPYAVGYAQGYLAEAGKRRAQTAIIGGAGGLLVGALVGVTVANQRTQ